MVDQKDLTEDAFLKQYDASRYPRPSVTVDICVVAHSAEKEEVLLIRRGGHPFRGYWAFPGGFASPDERVEESAARELCEETGLTDLPLDLVGVYSQPGRDPRGWVISCGYRADVYKEDVAPKAGDDAKEARWFTIVKHEQTITLVSDETTLHVMPDGHEMAFDHALFALDALGGHNE